MERFFRFIERVGNKLPHPVILFVYLCVIILGLSSVADVISCRSRSNTTAWSSIVASRILTIVCPLSIIYIYRGIQIP